MPTVVVKASRYTSGWPNWPAAVSSAAEPSSWVATTVDRTKAYPATKIASLPPRRMAARPGFVADERLKRFGLTAR